MRTWLNLALLLLAQGAHAQAITWDWAHANGGTLLDFGKSVAVAPDGSVYQLGSYQGPSFTVGDTTLVMPNGIETMMFLAKFDPDGDLIWALQPSGFFYDCLPEAIAVDSAGNVVVGGGLQGYGIDFGDVHLTGGTTAYDTQLLLVMFDADGNGLWGYCTGGTLATDPDYITNVCFDHAGHVLAVGSTVSSAIIFNGSTYNNPSPNMLFVLKFSPTGTIEWVATSNSICGHSCYTIAADEVNNVYIAGSFFNSTLYFGAQSVEAYGVNDDHAFLFKFAPNGQPLWGRTVGGSGEDDLYGICTDRAGHLYVAGVSASPTVTSGNVSRTNPYARAGVLARFTTSGTPEWIVLAGDSVLSHNVETDANGRVCVLATLTGHHVVFGANTLTNAREYNMCVLGYDTTGTPQWIVGAQPAPGGKCWPGDMALADSSTVYVTGYYAEAAMHLGPFNLPLSPGTDLYPDAYLAKLHVNAANTGSAEVQAPAPAVFPVPADRSFRVRSPLPLSRLVLFDAAGRAVLQWQGQATNEVELDVHALAEGHYVLRIPGSAQPARTVTVVH